MGLTRRRGRTCDRGAVHPHVRGAHTGRTDSRSPLPGPSPRAWGSRLPGAGKTALARSIPTCVGLTEVQLGVWARVRSIPTCVGLTPAEPIRGRRSPVHPHVRGAHGYPAPGKPRWHGPSPRAWGSLKCSWVSGRGSGPSPRAWGSPRRARARVPRRWSIPTCVGLTALAHVVAEVSPVHPHVRGAHQFAAEINEAHGRSIPTCVGLTPPVLGAASASPVHPHVRGAHEWKRGDKHRVYGPSPRAWGSQKLTCNFARRYLLVIWIVGSFAIHDTLDRFPEHRPLNGDMRGRRGIRTTPHGPAVPPSARTLTLPGGRAGPTRRGPARVPPTACEGRPTRRGLGKRAPMKANQ